MQLILMRDILTVENAQVLFENTHEKDIILFRMDL